MGVENGVLAENLPCPTVVSFFLYSVVVFVEIKTKTLCFQRVSLTNENDFSIVCCFRHVAREAGMFLVAEKLT